MNKEDNTSKVLNSKRTGVAIDTRSGVYGEYTAGGIKCKESAIKAVVARVHLSRLNYNDYIANKAKYLQSTTNKKKGVKRKLRESLLQEDNNTSQGENQVAKKGRGRPKKVQATIVSSVLHANLKSDIDSVKKKERPKREENETTNNKSKLKPDLEKVKKKIFKIKRLKRFNGDKNPIINSVRIRKPNPKFQDFVISSDVPFYVPSSVESPTKEKKEPIKIKPKPKLSKPKPKLQDFVVSSDISLFTPSSVESPTKEKKGLIKIKPKPKLPKLVDVTEVVPQDPLDISIGDDVVRSFLPVFDAPPQAGNVLILKNNKRSATGQPITITPNKRFKEKENLVNNRQPKLIKKDITPKPESQSSNASKLIKKDTTPKPESQSTIASKLIKNDTTPKPESQSSIASKLIKKDTTSKPESQNSNASKLIKKNTTPKPESQSSNTSVSDYSPPKLRRRSNSKPSTPLLKSPSLKVSPDLKVYSNKHKIGSQKSKGQKERINNSVTPQNKPRLEKIDSDVEIPVAVKENNITKAIPDTPKAKTKQTKTKTNANCSNNATKPKKNVRYVLVDSDNSPNRTKVSKSGEVDFNKLVRSLKSIKLPGAKWKIRIVVSRQQTISEVTFTNKEVNERCVKFSRAFTGYVITFGKSEVTLLGAPSKISSFNDVSILLDIVHNISPNDPVLEYCTSKNV